MVAPHRNRRAASGKIVTIAALMLGMAVPARAQLAASEAPDPSVQDGTATQFAPQLSDERALIEICSILTRAEGSDRDRSLDELAALGRQAVPTLFSLLSNPRGVCGQALPPGTQDLLADALLEHPAGAIAPHLELVLDDPSPAERRLAVDLLGRIGGADALDSLTELALDMSATELQARTIQAQLSTAFARVLSRHGEAYPSLVARIESLEPALQPIVVAAIGDAGNGRGLPALERLTGRSKLLDRAIIEAIGRLDPASEECLAGAADVLAWHLSSEDPEVRRAAIGALALHGGPDQVEALAQLLSDPDAILAGIAHASLRSITRMDFDPVAEPWVAWVQREFDWFANRADDLTEVSLRGEPGPAFAALRELSEHALFRRTLVERLAPALERPELAVASIACQAVGRLGGPSAAALLRRASVDARTEVAAAAELSLSKHGSD